MRLTGKKAVVTGGDQGIGQGIAFRLAEEGADIAIIYRVNAAGADDTRVQIEKMGRRVAVVQADVGKIPDARRVIQEAAAGLGPLDILINNAGIEKAAPFWEVTEEDYHRVIDVNMNGVFFTAQEFVRHLREAQRPGRIINISSVHEELPFPHYTAYCMSKGALRMMTRNLAIELAPLGITINNIAPGAIETPINRKLLNDPKALSALLGNIPLARLGQPGDVAGAAAFLASTDADYITGSTIVVDGGLLWNYSE